MSVLWEDLGLEWDANDRPEGWSVQDEWNDLRAQRWNDLRSDSQAVQDASQQA